MLDGADIHSETSAAIYVRQADKIFLTMATGSVNTLSNGGTFTAIDENNIDAVVFSKEDLTLNGNGTMTIESSAGHGVVSKDDLVLTSGTYEITASSHGLLGRTAFASRRAASPLSPARTASMRRTRTTASWGFSTLRAVFCRSTLPATASTPTAV